MNTGRPPRLLAICSLAILACGMASLRGLLPAEWVRWILAPALLVLPALPLILVWASREPSPLKVLYFAGLLSPALLGGLFLGLRGLLGAQQALTATLALIAALQVAIFFKPWHRTPLGKPAHLTLLGSFVFAGALLVLLLRSPGGLALASPRSLWSAACAAELLRPGPLENPFLAGTAWPGSGWFEPALAALSGLLQLDPTRCATLLTVLAWLSLPVGLYLWGAPLWREARRCALVPWIAIFATGAYLPGLDELWSSGPLLLGPWVSFLEPGPAPWVLAWGLAACMAAVHAARHAEAPWPGLCGLSLAMVCLLDAPVGLTLAGSLLAVALLCPGRRDVRLRLPLVLLAWTLAGWALGREVQGAYPAWGGGLELREVDVALSAGPIVLASLALILGRWRAAGGEGDEAGRRTILVLTCVVGLACVAHATWCPAGSSLYAYQIGALSLGVAGAGGLVDLWQRRNTWVLAAPTSLVLATGSVAGLLGGWGYADERRTSTAEEAGALALYPEAVEPDWEEQLAVLGKEPPPSMYDPKGAIRRVVRWRRDGRDLARALSWLGEEAERAGDPVLVAAPRDEKSDLKRRTLSLGLAANLPLWVTGEARLARNSSRQEPRLTQVSGVYGLAEAQQGDLFRELSLGDRPSYWLVEGADRTRTQRNPSSPAGVETRLLRRGAKSVFRAGRVEVFRFDPRGR